MSKGKVKPIFIILAAVTVMMGTIRFFFVPHWVSSHLNRHLDSIPGYQISYEDFSISLLTASVTLEDVTVTKTGTKTRISFFRSDKLRAGLDWSALPDGYWVAKVFVDSPSVNFINSPDGSRKQTFLPDNWTRVVNGVTILPVNTITVQDGQIKYHDFDSAPKVVLHMTDVSLHAKNLCNVSAEEKILSGVAEGSARVNNALIHVNLELNTFFQQPMFQLSAELTDLNLVDMKDFLRAYGQFDVRQGLFSLYTQAGTRDNKVIGFVKPLIQDVTIASLKRPAPDASEFLTRPSMRQGADNFRLATDQTNNLQEIHFEGSIGNGPTNLWDAVGSTLHNAFVEALVVMLEKSARNRPQGSPLPSVSPKQKASQVSVEKKTKKSFLRKIFKGKRDRKRDSEDGK